MANEIGVVHAQVDEILESLGESCRWVKNQMSDGKGTSGKPDYTVVYRGAVFGIECKWDMRLKDGSITTDRSRLPTPAQCMELKGVERAGGVGLVVDRHTVDSLRSFLSAPLIPTYLRVEALRREIHHSQFETKLKEITI